MDRSNQNRHLKTVFYIFGWTEKYSSRSTQTIIRSYIQRNDHNIVVLDWGDYSDGDYFEKVAPLAQEIGVYSGKIFLKLFEYGLKVDNIHIVGHSLGGQISGFIGKTIISQSNGTYILPRISALDPAGVGFYSNDVLKFSQIFSERLSSSDAKFVDVIHTDIKLAGAPINTGTVDFYPNGGYDQPGCPPLNLKFLSDPANSCSHHRSWLFWSESVVFKNRKTFHSIKCSSWDNFKVSQCDRQSGIANMGIDVNKWAEGSYFLQTNSAYQYSRNELGIVYKEED